MTEPLPSPGPKPPGEPTRILITGANGFVGRHLIARLLAEADTSGEDVAVFAGVRPDHVAETRQPAVPLPASVGWTGSDARVSVVAVEVTDSQAMEQSLAEARPQQIVHLAALASGSETNRDAVFAVNVQGTRNLLEAASHLSPFPRVLLISTGYVYGNTEASRPAREDDPIGPLWRYGAYADSKMEMETLARAYRGLTIVARPFSHTGPGQPPVFALPSFARQLARIERGLEPPRLLVGNLQARRDYLDVRDVVRAYTLLLKQGQRGTAYNIATGSPTQLSDLLEQLRALCAVPVTVETDPARLRPVDIALSSGDSTRLHSLTGWQPEIPLEQTLRDLLDYWRNAA